MTVESELDAMIELAQEKKERKEKVIESVRSVRTSKD